MDLLGLFFIGVQVSLVALYIILKNMDSNYRGDKAPPDDTN